MSDGCERCRKPKAGHHLCPDCQVLEALEVNEVSSVWSDWNSAEDAVYDEPEGTGWVSGPELQTTELSQVILCKYTAEKPSREMPIAHGVVVETAPYCPARHQGTHPDEQCFMIFVSAKALEAGGGVEMLAEEVRTNLGEPLYVNPVLG